MTSLKTERFVIKPAYLEVVRVTYDNLEDVAEWVGAEGIETYRKKGESTVVTFDGKDMTAIRCEIDDYICHAENGQFFALSNASLRDQFAKVEDVSIS